MKEKKRIVVKIGSSSLQHVQTGDLDYVKLEKLVRILSDLRNQGKEVVLVTSGAIASGKQALNDPDGSKFGHELATKQAFAAVGQARLMMIYQKLFMEYNHIAAQILMTKNTVVDVNNRTNAQNTFSELLRMGAIPIVNENDTIATYEIMVGDNDVLVGDNDTLSAIVSAMIDADLLILLSDIDGLYTDDPRQNKDAKFIDTVTDVDEVSYMGKKSTGSKVGTGGMNTKLTAAKIATMSGVDMVIANSKNISVINRIINGENVGTHFVARKNEGFDLPGFVNSIHPV